jgi:hypothetical protein
MQPLAEIDQAFFRIRKGVFMLELDLPLQLDILSDRCLRQTLLGLKFSAVQADAGP